METIRFCLICLFIGTEFETVITNANCYMLSLLISKEVSSLYLKSYNIWLVSCVLIVNFHITLGMQISTSQWVQCMWLVWFNEFSLHFFSCFICRSLWLFPPFYYKFCSYLQLTKPDHNGLYSKSRNQKYSVVINLMLSIFHAVDWLNSI